MKNPQEILKELIKEAADNVDGKFDYTSDPTTIVAERFAQQYIDANKELVEMLEELTKVSTINRFFEVKHKAIALLNKQS